MFLPNQDTLILLFLFVKRTKKQPTRLRFEFPLEAAKGGVEVEYDEAGPNGMSGHGTVNDGRSELPGFQYGKDVAVEHELAGRTLEFEILSVTRSGKTLKGFAGKRLLVGTGKPAPILGLKFDMSGGVKHAPTILRYRYRLLPNVRWHTATMPLG